MAITNQLHLTRNHLISVLESDVILIGGSTLFQNYLIGHIYDRDLLVPIEQIAKRILKTIGGPVMIGTHFHSFRSWNDRITRLLLAIAFVKACRVIKNTLNNLPAARSNQ